MTYPLRLALCALALVLASPAAAALNVFATLPEWGALVEELGGDRVKVYVATNALQDAHHVEAKPSLIARARSAEPLAARLAELDPQNAAYYRARHRAFADRWAAAIAKWEQEAAPLKGTPVVVQHKAFTYLEEWLGLKEVAALEPKPGVEPTTAHLAEVVALLQRQPAKMVLRAAFQNGRASEWIAERAKINVVVLPFTVGGDEQAKDLYGLFDDTIARLLKGAQ